MKTETKASEEQLKYLDKLRDSGATNMYGAGPYLIHKFGVTRDESHKILQEWMNTFSERHAEGK